MSSEPRAGRCNGAGDSGHLGYGAEGDGGMSGEASAGACNAVALARGNCMSPGNEFKPS